jgi:hypothetical protein
MNRINVATPGLKRTFCVLVVVTVLSATASAYTVVMRGGRRVEIPRDFLVTAATLTYEAAPGIQVTLQLAALDIPATEKANNEVSGSLLRRVQLFYPRPELATAPGRGLARRTITNRDLETSARRRRESEVTYEQRRKELGLPSVAQSRRQLVAQTDSFELELEQRRVAARESEAYWRERAAALRTEVAALDAELTFARGQLEGEFRTGNSWSSASFTSIVPFISLGSIGGRGNGGFGARGFGRHRSPVFAPFGSGMPSQGRRVWGERTERGQVVVNPNGFPRSGQHGPGVGQFPAFTGNFMLGSGAAYDYSYERSALVTRFNELAAARAGLNARWRELEEEARRAGASPGWLRQ